MFILTYVRWTSDNRIGVCVLLGDEWDDACNPLLYFSSRYRGFYTFYYDTKTSDSCLDLSVLGFEWTPNVFQKVLDVNVDNFYHQYQ